jgi:hypothetical protein
MFPVIFAIECRDTGFAFVGHSIDYRDRWRKIRRHLNKGVHTVPEMNADWRKYGPSAFTVRAVEALPEEATAHDVRSAEKRWRAHFARLGRLYNPPTCPMCGRPFDLSEMVSADEKPDSVAPQDSTAAQVSEVRHDA